MKIRTIQVLNKNDKVVFECNKGFSFLTRRVDGKAVNDVLMLKGKDIPEFEEGSAVSVIINTRSGERLKYYCTVSVCNSRQLRVIIDADQAKRLENQRRYHRIKTAINCRIVDITRNESVTSFNPNLYGKIYDINIGGVFLAIESSDKYLEDDIITFTTILNNNKLETSARVLRVQTSSDGEVIGYSCAFAAIASYQEDMISSYINHLQLEERRVELELEKLEKGILPE